MKLIYLAWLAVVADFWVFLTPHPFATSNSSFIATCVMHAGACALLATVTYLLLPARYRTHRIVVWLMMFDFAFIAPIVGPLGMLLITHTTLRRDIRQVPKAVPQTLDPLEYNVQSKEGKRSSQGAIRSRLTSNVPTHVRMQSLLTLQAVPKRVANPLLENLLADSSDDVRLLAFGMLDAEEKKLSVHIQRERKNLEKILTQQQRYNCLRHLGELHWELTYTALAQGEMRNYMLGEARRYIDEALALPGERDAGIIFLRGRILLAQGELDEAETLIQASLELGQPEASALPYLAEMAFRRRDLARVHELMARLGAHQVSAKVQSSADLWTGRDSVANFRDRSILAHI